MAQDTGNFNSELYNLLKVRGYKPAPLNSQNQRVGASQEADVIEFTFTKDGDDYGKAWVSVDDASNLKIYFDDEQQESPDTTTPGVDYDDTWTGLLKFLKNWAQRRQLSFELSNKDRLGDDMRQRDYYKMKEKLGEGYHSMGKKASYNDAVPNVKIVLQHNRALEEGEQRYRNVAKIFLENADGERFLAPTTRPGIARVYARHIAEGGVPNDDRWNHIKTVCEDYNKMAGFVRATRNKEFNESAQDLINEGANHYSNLRETLHKLTGHRGYHAYFESWTPALMEDEGEDLAINELFVQETMDPRIESVMPILSKLRKNVAEMTEIDTLAEWADSIISEKLEMDSTTKSMAVPADEMLDEAPGAETLAHNQSTEKKNLKAFGLAEETKEEPPIGKGKQAFIVTYTDGKKVTVLADHDWQAKETAKNHWKLPNAAGIIVKQKEVPGAKTTSASAPAGKDSAINKATDKAQPTQPDNQAEPTSTWGRVKDAVMKNWKVPGGDDSYGGTAKALAGMLEGDVIPFKKKKQDDDDDDDSWLDDDEWNDSIPSEEDFAAEEGVRAFWNKLSLDDNPFAKGSSVHEYWEIGWTHGYNNSLKGKKNKTPANDLNEMDKSPEANPYSGQGHRKGDDNASRGPDKTAKMMAAKQAVKAARKTLDKAFKGDVDENFISMAPQAVAEEEVDEGLDANQKRVGQLGPTEKVKNNNIGKLVGANESTEIDPELARIIEMARFKR
jgi:hypothetical protein